VLADVQAQSAALTVKRGNLEKEFSKQGAVRAEGVEAASRDVRSALLELGRRTAPSNVQVGSSDQVRRALADAETQVKRLQKDLERHVRALASADETLVNKGLLIIGGVALLVLVLLFGVWQATHHNEYLDTVPGAQKP
jgi:CHASE3 domain sensor protein